MLLDLPREAWAPASVLYRIWLPFVVLLVAAGTVAVGVRRDAAIGTHEAMGAIWFLDNPALQPEVMSVTARLCNWVQFLFAPTKLLDAIKSAPQTMLAKIANGVDPVQLAADAIELAQGGMLNEATF